MRLYGIRGATTVNENNAMSILEQTKKLLEKIINENNLTEDSVVSVLFSTTPDLTAEFPAKACRMIGWNNTALFGCVEADIHEGIRLCIRVLIHAYLPTKNNVRHIYLNNAAILRPEWSGTSDLI